MMSKKSKKETTHDGSKKMYKEENLVVDLELAIKKEKLRNKDGSKKMYKEENLVVGLELAVAKEKFKKKKKKKPLVGISYQNM